MIRKATVSDIPEILDLGEKFHAESVYAGTVPYCRDSFARSLETILANGAVFLGRGAMCGGVIAPLYFNDDAVFATELFWFADEAGDGPAVLKAWQDWTKEQGVMGDHMTVQCDEREDRMRRMMSKRQGYEAFEVSLFRRH